MKIARHLWRRSVMAVILVAVMVASLLPLSVSADAESGYTFDSSTGIMTVHNDTGSSYVDSLYNDNTVKALVYEDGVTSVHCMGLYALESAEIASTVTGFGNGTFSECEALTSLTFKGSEPPATLYTDSWEVSESLVIYVPSGSEDTYKTALGNMSSKVQTDPSTVSSDPDEHTHVFTEDGFCSDAECGEYNPDDADGKYVVTTAAQLKEIRRAVNELGDTFEGDTIELGGSIDISDEADWTAIGNADKPFAGTFDGKNNSVTGLTITSGTGGYKGLFGYNKGTVKDFSISGTIGTTDAYITSGSDNIGGAAGYNDGTVSGIRGNVTVFVKSAGIYAVGGIVGQNGDDATVTGCLNEADVNASKASGGIVGRNFGEITLCKNTGNISGNQGGKDGIGGIAGYGGNKSAAYQNSITYCYNTGTTSNPGGRWQGGIAGFADSATTVTNCYSVGAVTPGYSWNWNAIIGHVDSAYSTVHDNYSLDTITNGDTDASTQPMTIGTKKTEAELKSETFVSEINGEGSGFKANCGTYPVLSWEESHEHTWGTEASVEDGYSIYECTVCGAQKKEPVENKYDLSDVNIYVAGKDGENKTVATWTYSEPLGDGKGIYKDNATGEKLSILKDFTESENQVGNTAGYDYDVTGIGALAYTGKTRKPVNPGRLAVTVTGILVEDLIDYTSELSGGISLRGKTAISWTASDGSTKSGTQIYDEFYTVPRYYYPQYFIDQTRDGDKYYMPYSLAVVGYHAAQGEAETVADVIAKSDSMNSLRANLGQLEDTDDANVGGLSTYGIVGVLFEPVYNEITVKDGTLSGTEGTDAKYATEIAEVTASDNYFKAAEGETVSLTVSVAEGQNVSEVKVTDADSAVVDSEYADGVLTFTMPSGAVTVEVLAEEPEPGFTYTDPSGEEFVITDTMINENGSESTLNMNAKSGSVPVTATFAKLADLIAAAGGAEGVCSYKFAGPSGEIIIDADADIYVYNDNGAIRTAVDGGPGWNWWSGVTDVTGYDHSYDAETHLCTNPVNDSKSSTADCGAEDPDAAQASITLDKESTSVTVKKTLTLKATADPADSEIEWTSSNTKIATVDKNGKVTGVKQGIAVITAKIKDTDVSADCEVRVLFSDVPADHSFAKAVYWAADNGITGGYTGAKEGLFGIRDSVERGQVVTFLWRMAGSPAPKNTTKQVFKDVPIKHSFYKAIQWAYEQGIAAGYKNGNFGVKDNCTRGQIAMFLWRYAGKPAPEKNTQTFKDVPVKHSFYKAVQWGKEQGIIGGYTGAKAGLFGVNDNCTRGQMVTFLYRATV